jgi:flagellar FliL protein
MAEAKQGGKRDMVMTLVVVLLLTLVGAGAGFAVGTVLGENQDAASAPEQPAAAAAEKAPAQEPEAEGGHGGEAKDAKEGEAAASEEEEPEEDLSAAGLKVIPFPPVLTTLAEPKGKWIRLEGSILVQGHTEKTPEVLAEESGEQILSFLRSVKLAQLESASGVQGLRDDLNETVRSLSGGEVRSVLIHGLVIE